jgi:hypothetical protein
MFKKVNPVLQSRTARSNPASEEVFHYELPDGSAYRHGKSRRRVLQDQRYIEPRSGPRKKIVKNQNGEEGISRNGELQCCWSCSAKADSIQPVEIELHRDAATLENHSLKGAGPVLVKPAPRRMAFWSGLFELGLGRRSRGGSVIP